MVDVRHRFSVHHSSPHANFVRIIESADHNYTDSANNRLMNVFIDFNPAFQSGRETLSAADGISGLKLMLDCIKGELFARY